MPARFSRLCSVLLVACWAMSLTSRNVAADERIPLIVDTDIGTAIDDAFALAAVISSERFELLAVTTCTAQAEDRAWMICRFLTALNMKNVPVAFGRGEQVKSEIDWQIQYRRHPAVVWDRTVKPDKEGAEDVMARALGKCDNGQAVILALGPLTNVARLLNKHPDSKKKIARIIAVGGYRQVERKLVDLAAAETNFKRDVLAVRAVMESDMRLVIVPLDLTHGVSLSEVQLAKLFAAQTPLTLELQSLHELWQTDTDAALIGSSIAVRLAYDRNFCQMDTYALHVDDDGRVGPSRRLSNTTIAKSFEDPERFADNFIAQVAAHGNALKFAPPKNLAKHVERGGLPKVVHAFEDYDNDIEKRWWMTGKLELQDLPEGSRRAQRATITQDYDDLQGDMHARYRAVIFNPVPGPPMGPKTRLAFRYKLHGTDTVRVQLYSLSNGYHRYLSLTGLPRDKWQDATVDMTQMRRPDGTGGPLAADERIDDIQFYIDPSAELVIDEMFLYEAADDDEKQPFPRRILFTGWFDTGRQGGEWPGDFEIVPHEKPRTWKAAKSIANKETDRPWIRVSLRGERRLAPRNDLKFDYRLKGAEEITVLLRNSRTKQECGGTIVGLKENTWAEAGITFDVANGAADFTHADEIQFLLPKDAELQIDNLLLFEPAE